MQSVKNESSKYNNQQNGCEKIAISSKVFEMVMENSVWK